MAAKTPSAAGSTAQLRGWLAGRIPPGWFTEPLNLVVDRDEILIRGTISAPELPADADPAERAAAGAGRAKAFREDTGSERIGIARELEHAYGRKVSWAVRCGDHDETFTALSAPVMTRLRQSERMTLDTLVAAGVARSRSDALAWCVKLVGQHEGQWLGDLKRALRQVDDLREKGPASATD